MGTEKKIDLAQVMLTHLLKHYTVEQTFAAPVLYSIVEQHGHAPRSGANNMLRKLIAAGYVVRTDDVIENKRGGSDMPLYRLTGKVSNGEIPSSTALHSADVAERYNRLNQCQLNLLAILNNITRERECYA